MNKGVIVRMSIYKSFLLAIGILCIHAPDEGNIIEQSLTAIRSVLSHNAKKKITIKHTPDEMGKVFQTVMLSDYQTDRYFNYMQMMEAFLMSLEIIKGTHNTDIKPTILSKIIATHPLLECQISCNNQIMIGTLTQLTQEILKKVTVNPQQLTDLNNCYKFGKLHSACPLSMKHFFNRNFQLSNFVQSDTLWQQHNENLQQNLKQKKGENTKDSNRNFIPIPGDAHISLTLLQKLEDTPHLLQSAAMVCKHLGYNSITNVDIVVESIIQMLEETNFHSMLSEKNIAAENIISELQAQAHKQVINKDIQGLLEQCRDLILEIEHGEQIIEGLSESMMIFNNHSKQDNDEILCEAIQELHNLDNSQQEFSILSSTMYQHCMIDDTEQSNFPEQTNFLQTVNTYIESWILQRDLKSNIYDRYKELACIVSRDYNTKLIEDLASRLIEHRNTIIKQLEQTLAILDPQQQYDYDDLQNTGNELRRFFQNHEQYANPDFDEKNKKLLESQQSAKDLQCKMHDLIREELNKYNDFKDIQSQIMEWIESLQDTYDEHAKEYSQELSIYNNIDEQDLFYTLLNLANQSDPEQISGNLQLFLFSNITQQRLNNIAHCSTFDDFINSKFLTTPEINQCMQKLIWDKRALTFGSYTNELGEVHEHTQKLNLNNQNLSQYLAFDLLLIDKYFDGSIKHYCKILYNYFLADQKHYCNKIEHSFAQAVCYILGGQINQNNNSITLDEGHNNFMNAGAIRGLISHNNFDNALCITEQDIEDFRAKDYHHTAAGQIILALARYEDKRAKDGILSEKFTTQQHTSKIYENPLCKLIKRDLPDTDGIGQSFLYFLQKQHYKNLASFCSVGWSTTSIATTSLEQIYQSSKNQNNSTTLLQGENYIRANFFTDKSDSHQQNTLLCTYKNWYKIKEEEQNACNKTQEFLDTAKTVAHIAGIFIKVATLIF